LRDPEELVTAAELGDAVDAADDDPDGEKQLRV
jgi:hypothetical protein